MVKWSKEQRAAAWLAHRDRFLPDYEGRGYRPDVFWEVEHPEVDLEAYEDELAALVDLGLATGEEVAVFNGQDMFEDDIETAEYYLERPDQQSAFNKDKWEPLIEQYHRIFPDGRSSLKKPTS